MKKVNIVKKKRKQVIQSKGIFCRNITKNWGIDFVRYYRLEIWQMRQFHLKFHLLVVCRLINRLVRFLSGNHQHPVSSINTAANLFQYYTRIPRIMNTFWELDSKPSLAITTKRWYNGELANGRKSNEIFSLIAWFWYLRIILVTK